MYNTLILLNMTECYEQYNGELSIKTAELM